MKKLFLFTVTVLMFFGCQKDDTVFDDQNLSKIVEARLKVAKNIKADITISPSGDVTGVTDANSIESALNDLKAKGTILLESGTFYINRTIVSPDGFNGTLIGKSKQQTEIVGVGSAAAPFLVVLKPRTFDLTTAESGSFFYFPNPEGQVTVSNLAMTLPLGFETEDAYPFTDLIHRSLFSFITVNLGSQDADTNFDNLKLIGNIAYPYPGFLSGYFVNQPLTAIEVFGNSSSFPSLLTSKGNHAVTNSEISKTGAYATFFSTFSNASISLNDNMFSEIKQIKTQNLEDCNVFITNNEIDANSWGTIDIKQTNNTILGSSNYVKIKDNTFHSFANNAIYIQNCYTSANFTAHITGNVIHYQEKKEDDFSSVIFIGNGNPDTVVRDNKILGNGTFGIYQNSDNGLFKGNDLSGFSEYTADYNLKGNFNTIIDNGTPTIIDEGVGNTIQN